MIFPKPFYHVLKVKDHHLNKERILSEVSKKNQSYRNTDITDRFSYISNTDWSNQQDGVVFDWYTYSFSERDRESYVKLIHKKFGKNISSITTIWFNQYYANSGCEHAFHDHVSTSCDLTNIYYVELPDRSLRTVLKHPTTGKEIIPNVREGDIITFRSDILHKSPPNYTNTRKTVIAFNLKFI